MAHLLGVGTQIARFFAVYYRPITEKKFANTAKMLPGGRRFPFCVNYYLAVEDNGQDLQDCQDLNYF
jgi:hypothetical protein